MKADRVKKKKQNRRTILKGVGTITLDQNMGNHNVRSDREALVYDREMLQRDFHSVWTKVAVERELNCA